ELDRVQEPPGGRAARPRGGDLRAGAPEAPLPGSRTAHRGRRPLRVPELHQRVRRDEPQGPELGVDPRPDPALPRAVARALSGRAACRAMAAPPSPSTPGPRPLRSVSPPTVRAAAG